MTERALARAFSEILTAVVCAYAGGRAPVRRATRAAPMRMLKRAMLALAMLATLAPAAPIASNRTAAPAKAGAEGKIHRVDPKFAS